MTIGQYHCAKQDYMIENDTAAHNAINFVLALLDAKNEETKAAGSAVAEGAEILEAIETAKDLVEEIRDSVEALIAGEETA